MLLWRLKVDKNKRFSAIQSLMYVNGAVELSYKTVIHIFK